MTPSVSNTEVISLLAMGTNWPLYEHSKHLPKYRAALDPEPLVEPASNNDNGNTGEPRSGESSSWKQLANKYDRR